MLKNFLLSLIMLFGVFSLGAQKNFPAPELITLDQAAAPLADYIGNGKPTVIALWATWCQPCHLELDAMKPYLKKWEQEYGAQVLAISLDQRHLLNRIKPLASRKGWDYNVLVDMNGQLQSILGFRSIPQMYILDGTGKIVESYTGYETGRELQVDRLIKKLAAR